MIRIGASQIEIEFGNIKRNAERIIDVLDNANANQLDLVAFPECALTGYSASSFEEVLDLSMSNDDPVICKIKEKASEFGIYALIGFIEKDDEKLYNSVVFVGPHGFHEVYRKMHLPLMGVDRFVLPGNLGFQVFNLPIGRVGVNICYDQSFPESARILALKGAQLVVLCTNWAEGARDVCNIITNARALENHIYYLTADRVGTERGFSFIGTSRIVNPAGKTIAEGSINNEELVFADVNLDIADQKRVIVIPGEHEVDRIGDRRPNEYFTLMEKG